MLISTGLSAQRIDVSAAISPLYGPRAGAVVTFEGCTRADEAEDRQTRVVTLIYEAHESLAAKQLDELARQAATQWPLTGVVLLHRIGEVPVGESSVLVAAASPHRREAFQACEWLIDTLKQQAAIWKKEVFDNGSAHWVGMP